jgi:hypothetical protein
MSKDKLLAAEECKEMLIKQLAVLPHPFFKNFF